MKRALLLALSALSCLACGTSGRVQQQTAPPEDPAPAARIEPITRVALTDAEKARVEAANAFALNLLKEVYGKKAESIVLSPLSVQYALGMVNNGACGETEREISSVLGQEGRDSLNAFCRHLLTDLPRVDTTVTLSIANGIILNDRYSLKQPFKKAVERDYDAMVEEMSFADDKAVLGKVNGWCAEKTRGKITEILSDVSADAILFALNAVYFKGNWADAFEKKYTREEDFTTARGKKIKVQMMHKEDKFSYGENDRFQRLALPYGNGKYAMEVLLPKGDNMPEFLDYLSVTPWKDLKPSAYPLPTVIVSFPRFQTETYRKLNDPLTDLGMVRAFTDGAQFFDMVNEADAKISRVLHKARIEVEETGTVAAAVTAVEMVRLTAIPNPPRPKVFRADRPFVYFITERTSGAILFSGVYTGE